MMKFSKIKMEDSELAKLKQLIQKKKDNPNDVWAKESLNQYMEDLSHKYKLSFLTTKVNLDNGEIIGCKKK